MINLDYYRPLAASLLNPSGIIKVVDSQTGLWYELDMNKFLKFDYDEVLKFKDIFIYNNTASQTMRSKALGLLILKDFNNFYENKYMVHEHLSPSKFENLLESKNFLDIVNIVLVNELFLFDEFSNNKKNNTELSVFTKDIRNLYTIYKKRLVKNVAVDLLKAVSLDPQHNFHSLSLEVKSEIIEKAIIENEASLKVTSLHHISKIIGVREASKILDDKKNSSFLNSVLKSNLFNNKGIDKQIIFNDFVDFFKYDIDKYYDTLVNKYLISRDCEVLQMFIDYSPQRFKNIFKEHNYIYFLAGVNETNYKNLIAFVSKNSDFNLWLKDGILIKSLYNQEKKNVVEKILREYPVDTEEYYKLEKFMKKRSLKDDSKLSDYHHFMIMVEFIFLEYELKKSIPINQNFKTNIRKI